MIQPVHPFDLQARAELATLGLTGLLDDQRDGLLYFLGRWRARPPRADHGLWDCGDGSGRHVDALTLARSMVSNHSPASPRAAGDEQLEGWMLRLLGEEDLSWLPPEPWAAPWGPEMLMADAQPAQQYAEINWAQRGTLMGLLGRYLASTDDRYLEHARKLIDGLLRIAVRHPDGFFFPEGYYQPGGWHTQRVGLFPGIEETNAAVVVPAVRLFDETGYQPALDLADGLVRFALRHTQGYLADGRMYAPHGGAVQEHFHTRSNFIMGVLKLGIALGRREYTAWARQAYDHAKEWGTDFGWFPEHLGQRHGEICCTVDMLEIALLLGRHVDTHYYADAERFGRNHLLESQFLSPHRLEEAVSNLPDDSTPAPWGGRFSTSQDVVRRQTGAFASRPTLNDAFHLDANDLMQCCNASGTRGLYDLWHYAVEEGPAVDGAPAFERIHLRFSKETPNLKIVSHEPAAGRLDITARRRCRVEVRLPGRLSEALIVQSSQTSPHVLALPVTNGYVQFDASDGECVELHYPLETRTTEYRVGKTGAVIRCTGTWRGETLIQVDPPGPFCPLYERQVDAGPVEPQLPGSPQIDSI